MKLTVEEMEVIQKELNRRFKIKKDDNLVSIGFGPALKRGRRDKERPMAACFVVKKKKEAVAKGCYPDTVTISPRKGGLTRAVTLPTDVIESRGTAKATGEEVQYGSDAATVGAVVAWRIKHDPQEHWGVLTVAHLMPSGVARAIGVGDSATIRGPKSNFFGTIRVKSGLQSGIDAALLEVSQTQLLANEFITTALSGNREFVRSPDTLGNDGGIRGETLSMFGSRALIVELFHPNYPIDGLGDLKHIVEAKNNWAAETFRGGSSGAIWRVDSESACMQVAGLDRKINPYQIGFGQSLLTILNWLKAELGKAVTLVTNSFRLVATF